MFEEQLTQFNEAISGFVESDIFQLGIRVVVAYVLLIWLASAFWAYRDMRLRSASAFTPYLAAAAILLFTPIFFLFGLLLYRIVRPKETIAEVNDRTLAEEAILAEISSHSQCANCSRPVNEEWIICPTCRNRLRRVCPNCERLIELDWTLCAWCGKDFERADAPGLTAYMPAAARPAPRPQAALRVPPPAAPSASPAPGRLPGSGRGAAAGAAPAPLPPSKPQSAPLAAQPHGPLPRSSSGMSGATGSSSAGSAAPGQASS